MLVCKPTLPEISGGFMNIIIRENGFVFFINLDGGRWNYNDNRSMFWGKKAVVHSLFSREDTYFLCEKVGNFKCISGDFDDKTSVIRQKGESLNGCYKKTKHVKFSEKWTFLTPRYTYVRAAYQEVRNVRAFFFFFFVTPVLRFTLLPYCRRKPV